MPATDETPPFRRAMYVFMLLLLIGYGGFKSWHILVALEAWEGQSLPDTKYSAK